MSPFCAPGQMSGESMGQVAAVCVSYIPSACPGWQLHKPIGFYFYSLVSLTELLNRCCGPTTCQSLTKKNWMLLRSQDKGSEKYPYSHLKLSSPKLEGSSVILCQLFP